MSKALSHLIELNRNRILRYGKSKLSHEQAVTVLDETIDQHPDVDASRFVELYSNAVARRADELSEEPPLLASAIDQLRQRGFSDSDLIRSLVHALDKCLPATRETIARRLENAATDYTSA